MGCKPCCCLSSRVGVFIVAIINLVLGVIGLLAVGYLVYVDELENAAERNRMKNTEDDDLLGDFGAELDLGEEFAQFEHDIRSMIYSLLYPLIMYIIVGFCLLIGAIIQKPAINSIGLFLNAVLILGTVVDVIVMFAVGTSWPFIIPLFVILLQQMYCICVVWSYRSNAKESSMQL